MQRPWGEGRQDTLEGAQPWETGAGGPLGTRHQINPFTNVKGSPPSPLLVPRQDLRLARQLHHRECQVIGRGLVTCRKGGERRLHEAYGAAAGPACLASETPSLWW